MRKSELEKLACLALGDGAVVLGFHGADAWVAARRGDVCVSVQRRTVRGELYDLLAKKLWALIAELEERE